MAKETITVVYDRKKKVETTGKGKVELCIYLARGERKYLTIKECFPFELDKYLQSKDFRIQMAAYTRVIKDMKKHGEAMTIENFNNHLGIPTKKQEHKQNENKKLLSSPRGFIEFMEKEIKKENLQPGTIKRHKVVIDALDRYGKMSCFDNLTSKNVKGFDEFLREEDSNRADVSINNYHKIVKKYTRLAYQMELIPKNPYESPMCKFKRGECKERRPLSEEELLKVYNLKGLTTGEEHARDLFVFSAYTGLAYADNQNFDFSNMTQKAGKIYYIIGERLKTGHTFYTPILPPAMAILKKYDYKLPKMTNQDMNRFLHLVEARAELHKPLTSHVARHSFATLVLNKDIPIEDVARMLGHTSINTTRIYAKIQTKTIERHATAMAMSMSGMFK